MKYFTFNQTIEQIDSVYRELLVKLHPDKNSSATAHDDFIELKNEYDEIKIIYKHLPDIFEAMKPYFPTVPVQVFVPVEPPAPQENYLDKGIEILDKFTKLSSEARKTINAIKRKPRR